MDSPDPFTPGFGVFQGIPNRTLPDDCMEYALFVLDPASARTRLETLKKSAEELAAGWAEGYIWQRERFSLELVEKTEGTWCLQGRTEYGDSVEDEWFIVWMLRELSRKFTDLWIRVYDTDGEFLLIEAANALPKWLNPEIADHRVWLNSGNLLIIPLSAAAPTVNTKTAPVSRPLTLSEALTSLSTHTPSRIRLLEEEAFYRTSRYPAAAKSNLHYALCTVPRPIAHILHTYPSSIAAATEAFYLRDPFSLKALTKPTRFPPTDLVTVSVAFTKVLYAQLKGQVFTPAPKSGWPNTDGNAVDIGTKLTSGFEMLLSDLSAPQLSSPSRQATVTMLRDLLSSPQLPTDDELATWPKQEDAEDWLDVDYTDFEDTLSGEGKGGAGWGGGADRNLKKMVERFEAFLNDDAAGVDGAEFEDDMDNDDDDDDDDESEDEEDREVSFDEVEFEKMMREMMGMPGVDAGEKEGEDEDEEGEIRKMMQRVEDELREAGALEGGMGAGRIKEVEDDEDDGEDDDDDEEVDIDYNLAANMLESFKGQGGLAGPGGNLLARMGIRVPRDEGEKVEDEGGGEGGGGEGERRGEGREKEGNGGEGHEDGGS